MEVSTFLPISLEDCLRDSPRFRSYLEEQQVATDVIEQHLDKVVKSCICMKEAGKTYIAQQSAFVASLWELNACFRGDKTRLNWLVKIVDTFQDIINYQSTLLEQAAKSVVAPVSAFIKERVKGAKESRIRFEKVSAEKDALILRNAQLAKSKLQEVEEVDGLLSATHAYFRRTSLDHLYRIASSQAQFQPLIFSSLLCYVRAYCEYFGRGRDFFNQLTNMANDLEKEIVEMRREAMSLEKAFENWRQRANQLNETITPQIRKGQPGPLVEGYLFKRTSNAFKTWNRRWFYLNENQLTYEKKTGENGVTVMEDDLRICTVKPAPEVDRRFCFEVVSPNKRHILQADSEESYNAWVDALKGGIGAAIRRSPTSDSTKIRDYSVTGQSDSLTHLEVKQNCAHLGVWELILKIPGNGMCCDCGESDPLWASINLGITLCIDCCGVHRSLGVHRSKVRSLTLDAWEPEILKVMAELGNDVVNSVYQANVPSSFVRPSPKCIDNLRETFIKAKYVDKLFVDVNSKSIRDVGEIHRTTIGDGAGDDVRDEEAFLLEENAVLAPPSVISVDDESTSGDDSVNEEDVTKLKADLLLYRASRARNLPVMCHALAVGANPNWLNAHDKNQSHLHQAVLSGSAISCEYLILNGTKLNHRDSNGQTALHLATELGRTAQVCLLLKHKADQRIKDNNEMDALATAIANANADIVTLLRLARLNEDCDNDQMFDDVVKDFSHLTSTPIRQNQK